MAARAVGATGQRCHSAMCWSMWLTTSAWLVQTRGAVARGADARPLLNEHPVTRLAGGKQRSRRARGGSEYRAVFAQAFPQDANAAPVVDAARKQRGLAAAAARAATRWARRRLVSRM